LAEQLLSLSLKQGIGNREGGGAVRFPSEIFVDWWDVMKRLDVGVLLLQN
jgi:hypothetical protein